MSKSSNRPDQSVSRVPAWARNAPKMVAEKTCAVLKRSWWSGCASCASNVLKAFFFDVPGLNGLVNTGLMLVCACMTLYLLLDGVTKTFPDLMQVCLPPCGFNEAGVMEGDGGAVQWTDRSFQEVLHYVCVMTSADEQTCGAQSAAAVDAVPCAGAQPQKAGTQAGAVVPYCGGALVRMADVAKTGGSSHASVTVSGGDVPRMKAVISGDYKRIKIGKRSINLSRKFKARSFFRFVHGQVKSPDGLFYVEDMRDAFNSQFGGKRARSGWRSERLKEDLFKGLAEGDFEFLFAVVDQGTGLYRILI